MILIVYRTVLRSADLKPDHDQMTALLDTVAENTPGYIGAETFSVSPLETVGLLRFESEDAVTAWREHPHHGQTHVRGVEEVYSSYSVEVFHLDRKAGFDLSTEN